MQMCPIKSRQVAFFSDRKSDMWEDYMANPDDFETSFRDDLEKLAGSKSCFFCSKLWKSMLHFYAGLPYDLANDEEKRQEYAKGDALCPFHLWQLASMSSATGLSLALAEIAKEMSCRLSALMSRDRKTGNDLDMSFYSNNCCLICSHTGQIEMHYLDYFRKLLAQQEGLAAYEKSKGFCLRHIVLVIDGMDEEYSKFIIMHSVKRFSELSQNLLSFSQKTKTLRKDLIQPDEKYAVTRALIQLGGIKYLHYLLMD